MKKAHDVKLIEINCRGDAFDTEQYPRAARTRLDDGSRTIVASLGSTAR